MSRSEVRSFAALLLRCALALGLVASVSVGWSSVAVAKPATFKGTIVLADPPKDAAHARDAKAPAAKGAKAERQVFLHTKEGEYLLSGAKLAGLRKQAGKNVAVKGTLGKNEAGKTVLNVAGFRVVPQQRKKKPAAKQGQAKQGQPPRPPAATDGEQE